MLGSSAPIPLAAAAAAPPIRALVARGDWRALVRHCERALAANDDGHREIWRSVADALEWQVLPAIGDAPDERLELLLELTRIARAELTDDPPRLRRLAEATREALRQHPHAERFARHALARERRWLLARARIDDALAHVRHQMVAMPGGLGAMAAVAGEAACDFVGPAPESAWGLAMRALWLEQPARLSGLRPSDRAALLLTTLVTCADARAVGNGGAWRELRGLLLVTPRWLAEHFAPALAAPLERRHRQLVGSGGLERALLRLERAFRREPTNLHLTRIELPPDTSRCAAPLYQLAVAGLDFGIWTDVGGPILWVEPPR